MNDPIAYVSDFAEPADWIDAAFLLAAFPASRCALVAPEHGHERLRDLAGVAGRTLPIVSSVEALEPLPWSVVTTGYADGLPGAGEPDRDRIRRWTSRIFVVGGIANHPLDRSFSIHPRLAELHPERFGPGDDPRWEDPARWNRLLVSGEGIIWLPRDICLWRYDAVGVLSLMESAPARWLLDHAGPDGAPLRDIVLMSSTPAFCLSEMPDPMPWLRLFRTELLTLSIDSEGERGVVRGGDRPNAYAVVAIDGTALGKNVTHRLRSPSSGDNQ